MTSWALLLAVGAGVNAKADRVVLITGEALEGIILTQNASHVTLDHALLGPLVLNRDHLTEVSIDLKRETQSSAISPDTRPDQVAPETASSSSANTISDTKSSTDTKVGFGRWLPHRLLNDWSTQLAIGFTGYNGQRRGQDIYGKLSMSRETPRRVWKLLVEAFRSETATGTSRNEGRAEITRRFRSPESPWFVFGTGRYQYNRLKSWQDRLGAYAGLGNALELVEGFDFTAEAGVGGSYEYGSIDAWTPEAVFAAGGIAWSLSPRQTLRFDTRYFPDLRDFHQYRVEAESDWTLRLDKQTDTHLNIGLRHQYESATSFDDRSDLKYFAALKFSF